MGAKGLTTYQVAEIFDVHHTTVINWVNEGKLKAYTTPGGHRRIQMEDIDQFAEKFKIPMNKQLKKDGKLVLIVDDEQDILDELKDALSGNGFEMDFATNGFDAARKIYKQKPDLILLDFKMPGMNGFEVCDILKEDKETSKIPIIAVTAMTANEDRTKILKAGVNKFIPKPVNIDLLLSAIKEILKGGTQ